MQPRDFRAQRVDGLAGRASGALSSSRVTHGRVVDGMNLPYVSTVTVIELWPICSLT